MTKWVYAFGNGTAEGRADMKNLLGGKGANLAEMSALGLPVPPGFTLTTEVCTAFSELNGLYPDELETEIAVALAKLEEQMGARFGDPTRPLLVSVRSGARSSMPGMMDTVLNLGINDDTVEGLAKTSEDPRFAYDSYRRFIQMYGDVVLGVERHLFEKILDDHKHLRNVSLDTELSADDWREVTRKFMAKVEEELGVPFPQDPKLQLWGAISAVFGSWMNERAVIYRRLHSIPENWGTAVNVQAMVFGNMGANSATGVAFTRNPSTGENAFYGEYLINAQGEDVVAGVRTPQPLTLAAKAEGHGALPAMEEAMPKIFADLRRMGETLETHYADMQDMEFTVQEGKLFILQTRNGKRTASAALKIAVDLADDGRIGRQEAIRRIAPEQLDQLLHPTLDPTADRTVLARGLPASPGAASGKVAFTAASAESMAAQGDKAILVRVETSPEDIGGMHAAAGILTSRGGMTSHAAVVARGMGRPCVAGAGELHVDYGGGCLTVSGKTVRAGEVVTIDGNSGEVMLGEVRTIQPTLTDDFVTLMAWVDDVRRLKVRANAETPEDAETARKFGAEGIGLCRTEHMFFDPERIVSMREMILADDEAGRRAALAKLLPYQKKDFVELFTIMRGLPVTVRLLDPPLHEFLPHTESGIAEVAKAARSEVGQVKARAAALHEVNPMLGLRGCRLGIVYPEIYEMQCRAIFQAAAEVSKSSGNQTCPEVMVPLVHGAREFNILKEMIDRVAEEVAVETGIVLDYLTGTMIELPRAALRAGELARKAEFFSFGTNDLTQTTFGLSRDDSGSFFGAYEDNGIFSVDPFVSVDQDGVGELIEIAAQRGRKSRSDLKLGICGEHGGEPASIAFSQKVGLDYVSCSPYRVPIARLAAAQAALNMTVEVDA